MNLLDFYINSESNEMIRTDKGREHSYIEHYYNSKFKVQDRDKIYNILEIGIDFGYSLKLWHNWFTNSLIYGLDAQSLSVLRAIMLQLPRINALCTDAYTQETLDIFEDKSFDYIIEDGPHTISSQIFAAKYWSKKLKPGGTLVIEDIKNSITDYELIKRVIIQDFTCWAYDFRTLKGLGDDFIIEVVRNK